MSDISNSINQAIKSVVGLGPVGLHEPSFKGNEAKYLLECLESTFVSSVGKFVDRFESEICNFTGSKFAVAAVNGTSALHIALLLSGVKKDHEVLIPSLSFVASANAVTYCGAVPHFVDVDEKTLGICPKLLSEYLKNISMQKNGNCINIETGRIISSIVPMHTFGHAVEMEGIIKIANDYNLSLVEDAAESLGSFYHGKHTGTLGIAGALSFNGNKTITTGGGGAIITNDKEIASKAKHITTTAKVPHRWSFNHDEVGFNYRMPNINAALGCAQLEGISEILKNKRTLFNRYKKVFDDIDGVDLFQEKNNTQSNYWLQTLILDESKSSYRDDILKNTNDSGYQTRPIWDLLHTLKPYKNCPTAPLKNSESLEKRIINIPSSTYNNS